MLVQPDASPFPRMANTTLLGLHRQGAKGEKINNLCSLICLTWFRNGDTLPHCRTTMRARKKKKKLPCLCAHKSSNLASSELRCTWRNKIVQPPIFCFVYFTSLPSFAETRLPNGIRHFPRSAGALHGIGDCRLHGKAPVFFGASKFEIYLFRFNYHVHDGCHSETPPV